MENINDLSDREVLLRASGDNAYLIVLVERYRSAVYNFVFRIVGLRETAEDIVQETFLRCLKHSHKCPPIQYVSTWLYTIAGNLAKTELRRRKRWHWVQIGPNDDEEQRTPFYEPVAKDPLPGEATDSNRVVATVTDAIHNLPQEFREAVLLRDLNGFSYDEISKIINCPIGTVKSRVNRGRLQLQKMLRSLATDVIGTLAAKA